MCQYKPQICLPGPAKPVQPENTNCIAVKYYHLVLGEVDLVGEVDVDGEADGVVSKCGEARWAWWESTAPLLSLTLRSPSQSLTFLLIIHTFPPQVYLYKPTSTNPYTYHKVLVAAYMQMFCVKTSHRPHLSTEGSMKILPGLNMKNCWEYRCNQQA